MMRKVVPGAITVQILFTIDLKRKSAVDAQKVCPILQ